MSSPYQFFFVTGQVGAEKAIKAEVASTLPQLNFAFSKPGFITFKNTGERLSLDNISNIYKNFIFTRLFGEVVHQVREIGEAKPNIEEILKLVPADSHLHTFDRDQHVPGDEFPGFDLNELSSFKGPIDL